MDVHQVAVVNCSQLDDDDVAAGVAVLQTQVNEDFAPVWDVGAELVTVPSASVHMNYPGHWGLILLDRRLSLQPDPLAGYRDDFTRTGLPLGKVFVDRVPAGQDWTQAASHELLEMLADPTLSGAPFRPRDGSRLDALEVCDPCAAYEDGYELGGRIVADFVFPAWFGADASGGRLDERGLIREPGLVRPGGHCLVVSSADMLWRVTGSDGPAGDLNEPGTRVQRRLASLRPHISHVDLVWSP